MQINSNVATSQGVDLNNIFPPSPQELAKKILEESGKTSLSKQDFAKHLEAMAKKFGQGKTQNQEPQQADFSQLAEQLFAKFDANNDDSLDQDELSNFIAQAPKPEKPGLEGADKIEKDLFNGKKELSVEEFKENLKSQLQSIRPSKGNSQDELNSIIEKIAVKSDLNGDGKISAAEMQEARTQAVSGSLKA
jgi:Ca2+-binding EF-hand superfamily protein